MNPRSTGISASRSARSSQSLAPARVRVAYPGVWLRDDVYATHGHYGDRHNTVPILERLGAGLTVRVAGEPDGGPARAEDYEAALAPMYAWADTVAQSGGLRVGGGGSFQIAAWQRLNGGGGRRGVRSRAMALGLAAAVAGLNRAGLGPAPTRRVRRGAPPRRARRRSPRWSPACGVPASHVIFGHTHRAGPLPGGRPQRMGAAASTPAAGCTSRASSATTRSAAPTARGSRPSSRTTSRPALINLLDPA